MWIFFQAEDSGAAHDNMNMIMEGLNIRNLCGLIVLFYLLILFF